MGSYNGVIQWSHIVDAGFPDGKLSLPTRASQNGSELPHASGRSGSPTISRSTLSQKKRQFSLLTPLHSLLALLGGPPLCGGSAPATPPLLQHPKSTGCRYP